MAHPCIVKSRRRLQIFCSRDGFLAVKQARRTGWVLVKHFCFLAVVAALSPAAAYLPDPANGKRHLLFGIDEDQRISAPKDLQTPPDVPSANPPNR
jgi:hypothetical protein